ncbi:MAG: hypothetical protein K0U38_07310 [Epsilonproteobacteria bacterium]|nr:hypothetical protein [Campylobacterota bacterium]
MHKEILRGIGFFLLVLALLVMFFVRPFVTGFIGNIPHFEYLIFFFSGLFLWISLFTKPKKVEFWVCQNCHTELVKKQIKFGLCPICGTKVKGFRGLSHQGAPII